MIDENYLRELLFSDKNLFYKNVLLHFETLSLNFIRQIKDIFPINSYFEHKYFNLNINYKLQLKGREDYFTKRFPRFKEFWKNNL